LKLKKWALIAEILSAVAVVMSLIFVGLQIKQGAEETALNTKAVQTNAYQGLVAQISSLNALLIENPELVELVGRAQRGDVVWTPIERRQVTAFLLTSFRHGEMAYVQYENGLIDEPSLFSMLSPTRFMLNFELGREVWANAAGRSALNARFAAYVDELVADDWSQQ
jgi:hypothetical protein